MLLVSTLALTDSAGTTQTSYTFEPFGNTSVTGAPTTNSFAYTGRENVGTHLYHYRARYYNPQLQRFVSEDPIGFRGGDTSLYLYSSNSPSNLRDPLGLTWENFWNNPIMDFVSNHANWLPGACSGGAFYWGGVQGAGDSGLAAYFLGDLNYSPESGWRNGGGALFEGFLTAKHTELGGGAVAPNGEVLAYALPYERSLPGGFQVGTGPVYAANFRNYDGISIGWIVDVSTPNPTGMGAQGNAGAGLYLTFTNASSCLEKMLRGRGCSK
jgi:RHS repeat-associated protein